MPISLFYWAGFLLYSVTVIGIGLYIWKKEKKAAAFSNNESFWQADSRLKSGAVGLSISASMMSISWSGVYGVQLFYWYGIGGAWLLIIPWLVTMAGFYYFTPLFRKLKVFSQPQLLHQRFGSRSRQLLAPALIVVFITWTGAEIYAAGHIIAPFLKIPVVWTLLLISIVVAAYSFTGGFAAVVSTDKIQFLLVAIFISVVAGLSLSALPAGTSIFETPLAPKAVNPAKLISPGIGLILLTFVAYLPGWLIETDVWIRLQAANSNQSARRGVAIAAINSFVFVGVLPMVIGLSALVLYPPVEGSIPLALNDGSLIFTAIMHDFAPEWLSIILSVGLIAAAMSTIDTCANIAALSFSNDLLEPVLKKKWSANRLNLLARITSVAAVFVSFFYAVFTDSLWDIFYLSSGILTTTVFIPVIGSFLPNTKAIQVNLAILLGFVSTLGLYFLESRGHLMGIQPDLFSDTGLGYIVWGLLFSFIGFLAGKFLNNK